MTDSEILGILKIDLQITSEDESLNSFLLSIITSARKFIGDEGIVLDSSVPDGYLVEMYSAYLYRRRRENYPMPRALRWALNNRLFRQKVNADG